MDIILEKVSTKAVWQFRNFIIREFRNFVLNGNFEIPTFS